MSFKKISESAVRSFYTSSGALKGPLESHCPLCNAQPRDGFTATQDRDRGLVRLTGGCGHQFEGPIPPSIRG